MAAGTLSYNRMVDEALKGVVRAALKASEHGLPGDHHFYITFRTSAPGVVLPDYLRARYPSEMTILLQHQFWGLEVDERAFAVTLSFNRVNERLTVPFAAVTAFEDPSAKFGLQFQGHAAAREASSAPPEPQPAAAGASAAPVTAESEPAAAAEKGQVIALDAFRK